MRVITEEYRRLNVELHAREAVYGSAGKQWAGTVRRLIARYRATSLLDYGCGKGSLAKALAKDIDVHQYDPAIEDHAAEPSPADIVTCTDVLEHIEPELLDNVLEHIRALTNKVAFFNISTRLDERKLLADGSNPHKIVWDAMRWIDTLCKDGFSVVSVDVLANQIEQVNIVVEPVP